MNFRLLLVASSSIAVSCSVSPTDGDFDLRIAYEDYAAAEKLLSHHLGDKVKNENPEVNWLGSEDRFWYKRDGDSGPEFVLVDATNGERQHNFEPKPPEVPAQSDPGMLASRLPTPGRCVVRGR